MAGWDTMQCNERTGNGNGERERRSTQGSEANLTCCMVSVSFVPPLLEDIVRDAQKYADVQRIHHVLRRRNEAQNYRCGSRSGRAPRLTLCQYSKNPSTMTHTIFPPLFPCASCIRLNTPAQCASRACSTGTSFCSFRWSCE